MGTITGIVPNISSVQLFMKEYDPSCKFLLEIKTSGGRTKTLFEEIAKAINNLKLGKRDKHVERNRKIVLLYFGFVADKIPRSSEVIGYFIGVTPQNVRKKAIEAIQELRNSAEFQRVLDQFLIKDKAVSV